MYGDTANFWEDIELRIDPEPLCTSYHISSMNKKATSNNPLKPKAPVKWVFMDIIPSTDVRPFVTYTPCATYSNGKTGNIITFAQFEEGGLLSENCDDAESSDKSDDDSNMPPLHSKKEMDVMESENESDDEPMSMKMLEDIRDGSQSCPNVNRIEVHYKICERIKQRQL